MAITNQDGLLLALASKHQDFPINRPQVSGAGMGAGNQSSLWKSAGWPAAGTTPTTAAACDNTTTGGLPFANPSGSDVAYLAKAMINHSLGAGVEVHDRLAHMGGLSGTVTTAQTVGLDLNALGTANAFNLQNRIVNSNYSRVQWFIEWYSLTGATAVTATVSYTDQTGTSGKTTTVALVANVQAARFIQIFPSGTDSIRSIESITLSVSTGTAGNFGVTATILRSALGAAAPFNSYFYDWSQLGLPIIYSSSCLMFVLDHVNTLQGTLGGTLTTAAG